MDVFVIPVGPDQYELYCEQPFSADSQSAAAATGFLGRFQQRFEDLLRRAEQWEPPHAQQPRGLVARVQDRAMGWVAERIAEQRLLWNLRRETTVTAAHPDDLALDQVRGIVHRVLQQDLDRHQYWVWVDGLLFLVTFVVLGPLFLLIPGIANLPALYFGFRAAGHWYSRGGARHGLQTVVWEGRRCPPLTELRDVASLPPAELDARVHDIATRLHLQNLASFYERVTKATL